MEFFSNISFEVLPAYLEVFFVAIVIGFSKKLRKYGLGFFIPVAVAGFVIDIVVHNLGYHDILSNQNTFRLMALIIGLRFLPELNKEKLDLLLIIVTLFFLVDILTGWYAFNGWYNIHIHNTCRLLVIALYLLLFFRLLNLKDMQRRVFLRYAVIILSISVFEYAINIESTSHINMVTLFLINFQNIFLSGWLIARLVTDPTVRRIYLEAYFWLFAGLLIDGLVHAATNSLHAYLVANPDIARHFFNAYHLYYYSENLWSVCVIIAFLLTVRNSCISKDKPDANTSEPVVTSLKSETTRSLTI